MWRVDQVFLSRKGQRLEVVCSLVNDAGGLRNLSTVAPTTDPAKAVRFAAAWVAGQGNVASANRMRLRWSQRQMHTEQENLRSDEELEMEFIDAFLEARSAVFERMH